ncbi:MAG: peptidylprolyl isomerase [Desulfuromonadales bacterium]|nr:peptidylprolyl isomerase [Desulfuromonadales bacterium]
MNQTNLGLLLACLFLSLTGGCASKEAVVVKEPAAPTIKIEQPKVLPAVKVTSGKVVNTIVAIVNDDVVTLYEVDREAQSVIREAEKKSVIDDAVRSQIRHAALEHLIEKKLLDQKIRELNIKVSDEEIKQAVDDVKKQNNITSQEALVSALASQGLTYEQYRAQLQEQIEKLKLVSMEVRAKIQVGETEMREYYEANRAKYSEEETFRARHIFFRTSEKAPADEIKRTMTTALMVLAEAKSGKDFVELAKTYSEDPAARKDGGDLGAFKKGEMMPELEAAIVAMKPGEVSELVYTTSGFHIIKLEERSTGKMKPFDTVKADIEDTLYRKKSEERFNLWIKELRKKASIEMKSQASLL